MIPRAIVGEKSRLHLLTPLPMLEIFQIGVRGYSLLILREWFGQSMIVLVVVVEHRIWRGGCRDVEDFLNYFWREEDTPLTVSSPHPNLPCQREVFVDAADSDVVPLSPLEAPRRNHRYSRRHKPVGHSNRVHPHTADNPLFREDRFSTFLYCRIGLRPGVAVHE